MKIVEIFSTFQQFR
jgi:hypothetical protein